MQEEYGILFVPFGPNSKSNIEGKTHYAAQHSMSALDLIHGGGSCMHVHMTI